MAQFIISAGLTLDDSLDINDTTNYIIEKKGYVVAAVDKDGNRPITLTVLARGKSTDQLNTNQAALALKLEEAEKADGPNGIGLPVQLWVRLGDNQTWTYWTVRSGSVVWSEKETAAPDRQMEGKVTLVCYSDAMTDYVALPAGPAQDSTNPIFLQSIPGDCSALTKLIIRDVGTVPIGGLWVARHGHLRMRRGDFEPFYPLVGSQTLSTAWQTLGSITSPQGNFDQGLLDIVIRANDTSKPLVGVEDLDGTLLDTGGLSGGFYEYVETAFDAWGNESVQSNPFDIQVPTGSNLVDDANPDPTSLKWAGPLFLGGSCLNPGVYSIDKPGLVVPTSSGLQFTVQSDGWLLGDLVVEPLLVPKAPIGNVAPTNKLPPKEGDIGYAYTVLNAAFPASLTGQYQFQYDIDLTNLVPGPLQSPIFFPQLAPFGLMYSPYGWALYCSSASTSQDMETLVGDWKSGKLKYVVFDSNLLGSTHTILLAMDWRNGPLTCTLSVDGNQVASIDAGKNGNPANDVSLGLVVTNTLPEFVFQRIIDPDQSKWSYTKVQVSTSSDSNSSSSTSTTGSSNSSSTGHTTSDSVGMTNGSSGSSSNSLSSNNSNSTSNSTNNSNSGGNGKNSSDTASQGFAVSASSQNSTTGNGHTDGSNTSSSVNESITQGTSNSQSSSHSNSSSGSLSTGNTSSDSTSDSSSNSTGSTSSSSSSTSTSHSDSTNATYQYDVPLASYTRKVTWVGQVQTISKQTSTSSSSSSNTSFTQTDSTSSSISHSKNGSTTQSGGGSSGGDSNSSVSNSGTTGSTDSKNSSTSSGSTSDANITSDGFDLTKNSTSSADSSDTAGSNTSGSSSTSTGGSTTNSGQDSLSTSNSTNTSSSTSTNPSTSSSASTSTSSDTSTSTSISIEDVYLVQPLIETIIPDMAGVLAQATATFSNVRVADGPIGTGSSVQLNWTPPTNAASQRIYRILNTGAGSPANDWEYKNLGGTDSTFTDSDQSGWISGTPPETLGPQSAYFRVGYAATPSDPLKYTQPVQANLSNGADEFLKLVTLTLPPSPRAEPMNPQPGPFYLEIQVQTDDVTISQSPKASVNGLWLLSQSEAYFQANYRGTNTQALQFELNTNRTHRNSALAKNLSTGAQVATLDARGELTLNPGGNYLAILATDSNGQANPGIRFTAQIIYTPRTQFATGE